MRTTLLLIILLPVCLLHAGMSKATTGWKWGAGTTLYGAGGAAIEAWPVAAVSGGVFLSGFISGDADSVTFGSFTVLNTGHYTQLFVAKADATGHYLWTVSSQGANVFPVAMAADAAGNLYILGKYEGTSCTIGTDTLTDSTYTFMCFAAKIDPTGHVVWTRNVAPQTSGTGISTGGGSVYITGNFKTSTLTIGSTLLTNHDPTTTSTGAGGTTDVFVARYAADGTPLWAESAGGDSTDNVWALAAAEDGSIYIAGKYLSDTFYTGATNLARAGGFFMKYDSNGHYLWADTMSSHIAVNAMTCGPHGGVYTAGSIDTDMITGTDTLVNAGFEDAFIAKYDNNGSIIWARSAGGNRYDIVNSISTDLCGRLWLCGQMGTTNGITGYTMNFSGHTLSEPSGGYDPMFIAEYDTTGHYMQSMALPSGGDDESGISVDNAGNFYTGGDYLTAMHFGTATLAAPTHEVAFIAKYEYDVVLCHAEAVLPVKDVRPGDGGITIYPNPVNSAFIISSTEEFADGATATLYDMTGRRVKVCGISGHQQMISTEDMAPGIYQCDINTGTERIRRRIMIAGR